MIFNYIFLLDNYYTDCILPDPELNLEIVIPWHEELIAKKQKHILQLNRFTGKFCFSMPNLANSINKNQASKVAIALTPFFFLSNYIKKSNAYYVITDLSPSTNEENKVFKKLETELLKQGINVLNIHALNDVEPASTLCYTNKTLLSVFKGTFLSGALLDSFVAEIISNSIISKIIVPVKTNKDLIDKLNQISILEQSLKDHCPQIYDLAIELKNEMQASAHLLEENKKLHSKIDNYKEYLRIIRETSQWYIHEYHRLDNLLTHHQPIEQSAVIADVNSSNSHQLSELAGLNNYLKKNRDEILNWYTDEYEILPLWYKRVGHVIKVVKGKRKLKSLFK